MSELKTGSNDAAAAKPAHSSQSPLQHSGFEPLKNETSERHTTPRGLIFDALLTLVFFVLIYQVVRSHVQSDDPFFIHLWGGGGAACLTGVFWLALQMFRVVLKAQRHASRH